MKKILALSAALVMASSNVWAAVTFIKIDGSSTVYPITEAVAEEFQKENKSVRITVGISGTGGGFKRFCRGETDISNASRPIKASEIALCKEHGIEYIEVPVAYDGLSVMVNPANTWANDITVEELNKIWGPDAQGNIKTWNQVRPEWPNQPLALYGPGTDSGTFDYFTEVINGKTAASRGDYTSSEDDNVLVQGISKDKNAMGYFGYAYYIENQDQLKLVAVNGVKPSPATINDGSYSPLSRPIFIYVSKKSAKKQEVRDFANFYLENGGELADEVGYIGMPAEKYTASRVHFMK